MLGLDAKASIRSASPHPDVAGAEQVAAWCRGALDVVADEVAAMSSRSCTHPRAADVALGASPRAAVHLLAAAKASARLRGRAFVTPTTCADGQALLGTGC